MVIAEKPAFSQLLATEYNQLVRASNEDEEIQFAHSFSASSAIGTTTTAVLTITNCVLRAGRAYSIKNIGGIFGSVSNFADFSLWKTSTAGTQIGAFYRTPSFGAPQMNCYGEVYMRRTAASDLTLDLVLAVNASTGTVTHDAAANRPRALVVSPVGAASSFGFAFDVT